MLNNGGEGMSGGGEDWRASGALTREELIALGVLKEDAAEEAADGAETEQSAEEARAGFERRGEDTISAANDAYHERRRKREAKAEDVTETDETEAEEAAEVSEAAEEEAEETGGAPMEAEKVLSVEEREQQVKAKEIENLLAGRTAEVAAREMTRDMKKLEEEIEGMKLERYLDPKMREYHKRQLEQAMAEYGAMSMRREKVLEQMSAAEVEAATFETPEGSAMDAGFDAAGEADANTAEKMTLAAFDQVLAELDEGDAELRRLLEIKRQEIEQRRGGAVDETGFAQAEAGAAPEQTEEERSEQYWQTMSEMAAEAEENPGRWMSEEEKAEMAREEAEREREREEREQRALEKARKRGGFRRFVKRMMMHAGAALMAASLAMKTAAREDGTEAEMGAGVEAEAETEAEAEDEAGAETEAVAETEEDESEKLANMSDDALGAFLADLLGR